ncbi:MAG TPA: pyridoxine 5'-phosphate synthase [Gemmatimonadaceae bacterium]|nr:pyridoxine 5'-phosphate synthase [Gemmatimonadaceae bacterium]
MERQRLYINIDHVATLRQARRGDEPDPVEAALLCEFAGADGITAHLREDRRHMQDADIVRLATSLATVLNLEMACTDEMLAIAERVHPHQVTLVPERRQEITTEGGLDVSHDPDRLRAGIERMNRAGIRTSLFITPDRQAVERSHALGAVAIELHTGQYANSPGDAAMLRALQESSRQAGELGLAVHAGHGLTVANVWPVAAIPEIEELNIGHSVVSRAVFVGLADAVRELRRVMDEARASS